MQILIQGAKPEDSWASVAYCTGIGSNGGGCHSKLSIVQGDLFTRTTAGTIAFRCGYCRIYTDVPTDVVPPKIQMMLLTQAAWEVANP